MLGVLCKKMNELGLEYEIVSHQWQDTRLRERTNRVNAIDRVRENVAYLDIHANAEPNVRAGESGSARGLEVFTSRGETISDKIASICPSISSEYPI